MLSMRRVLGVAVSCVAGIGACLGPGRPPVEVAPSRVFAVSSREGRFPNGMRVIVETVDDSSMAGIALAIDAGSVRDPEGQSGLAHLVEHNVFEAQHGDAPPVEQRLNRLAA